MFCIFAFRYQINNNKNCIQDNNALEERIINIVDSYVR